MNQRQIAKALREAVFSPSKPGPLKIIADVGNINYYIRRATEFLTLSLTALTRDQRVKYFDNALGMVALAKVKTQDEMVPVTQTQELATITGVEETNSSVDFPAVTHSVESTECKQNNCVPEKCIAANGFCPGKDVLDAAEEIHGKMDKPNEDGVQSPNNSVWKEHRNRVLHMPETGVDSPGSIPAKTQSRPKTANKT